MVSVIWAGLLRADTADTLSGITIIIVISLIIITDITLASRGLTPGHQCQVSSAGSRGGVQLQVCLTASVITTGCLQLHPSLLIDKLEQNNK